MELFLEEELLLGRFQIYNHRCIPEDMLLFTIGGTLIFGEYVNGDMTNYSLCFSVKLLQIFFLEL